MAIFYNQPHRHCLIYTSAKLNYQTLKKFLQNKTKIHASTHGRQQGFTKINEKLYSDIFRDE